MERKRKLRAIEDASHAFDTLRENANNLLATKKQRTENAQLTQLVTEGTLLFLQLRENHRDASEEIEDTKVAAQKAKPRLDQLNLQLQNLLYERNYYLKEIQRCKEFKPKHQVADLVEVEQFLEKAPAEWNKRQPSLEDSPAVHHKFMLHRLQFELQERKRLCKELEDLRAEKVQSQLQLQSKQDLLKTIQTHLSSLHQTALPLQQYFGAPTVRRAAMWPIAQYLPVPLYTLYARLQAYKESSGDEIDVTIIGEVDRAIRACVQEVEQTMPLSGISATGAKSKHPSASGAASKSTKKHTSKLSASSEEIYKQHPLEVVLRFSAAEDGVIRFSYLPILNLVTANGDGGLEGGALSNLYPGDTGTQSPNSAHVYQFQGEELVFSNSQVGRPYRWVQELAGLQFLPPEPTTLLPSPTDIIVQLTARWKARRSLWTQLELFAKHTIAVPSPSPQRNSATFVSWAEIKPSMWQEYAGQQQEASETQPDDAITCRYYSAVFRRGDAVLDARVALSGDYPVHLPEFRLKMVTGVDESRAEQLKELETQLNSEKFTPGENMALSILLHKVQTTFEVIMEAK